MFDTHCHLFDKEFENSLDQVIISSREVRTRYFMVPGVSVETSKEAIKIANTYQDTYCAVGIHPSENLDLENLNNDERKLEELVNQKKVVALGECGLDYYRFKSSPDVQKKYLEMHVKLALKYEKALILHNRQSTSDILNLLSACWQDLLCGKVIFHCSSLEPELVEFSKIYDAYLGIDGDITYDQFKQKQIKQVSMDRLLLETDSPYLLPEPLKSLKKYPNSPANLSVTADFVSNLLSISREKLTEYTTQNAKRVFGLV